MTDRAAPRVSIRNATCIINYEFPMKKSDFGERLSCLLGAMKDKVYFFTFRNCKMSTKEIRMWLEPMIRLMGSGPSKKASLKSSFKCPFARWSYEAQHLKTNLAYNVAYSLGGNVLMINLGSTYQRIRVHPCPF